MRSLLRRTLTVLPVTALGFGLLPGLNPVVQATPQVDPAEVDQLAVPVAERPVAVPAGPGAEPPAVPGLRDADVDEFGLVGVSWEGEGAAGAWVRVREDDGWTDWSYLPRTSSQADPGSADDLAAGARTGTEPLWVGEATGVEVRLDVRDAEQVSGAQAELVEPGAPDSSGVGTASAAVAQPTMYTRKQWGGERVEDLRLAQCPHGPGYSKSAPATTFVHHTAGNNDYTPAQSAAIVQGIYAYHVKSLGWCDIGYNVLVDKYGQVFEGRYGGIDKGVVGAHTVGFNNGSFGISVLGNYTSISLPAVAQAAMARVIGYKMSLSRTSPFSTTTMVSAGGGGTNGYPAGTAVTFNAVSAHRDTSPKKNLTADPGTIYGRLPEIRQQAAAYMAEKVWLLRSTADAGGHQPMEWFGSPGSATLACDFAGNGTSTFAAYDRGRWQIRTSGGGGGTQLSFDYGADGMRPVCGDWDGDGKDGIGVYQNGVWFLRETPTAGPADRLFAYGWDAATPVVGRWTGGADGVGVVADGVWLLRGSATPGGPDAGILGFGWRGVTPVPGDWDGDGKDTVGIYSAGTWAVRDALTPGDARWFDYGAKGWAPVVGSWSGVPHDGVGVTRTWP